MKETKTYLIAGLLFIATGGLLLLPARPDGQVGGAYVRGSHQFPMARDRDFLIPERRARIATPEIRARAAVVKDVGSDVTLFEKNPEEPVPIASLTKIMTALVVSELMSPEDMIKIENSDTQVVPYKAELVPGLTYTVEDLLAAMLVSSANDAALALARHYGGEDVDEFVRLMNDKAERLGMGLSSFSGPVGFDSPDNFATVLDLTRLVDEFLRHNQLMELVALKEVVIESTDGRQRKKLLSTNELIGNHELVKGIKTGYTTEALGGLIIYVAHPVRPYYSIVLGSPDREGETQLLLDWVEEAYLWK